jgi:hypothetical protein
VSVGEGATSVRSEREKERESEEVVWVPTRRPTPSCDDEQITPLHGYKAGGCGGEQITAEKQYSRLVTFLETLLTLVWYPTTVATLSRRCKDLIHTGFQQTVDDENHFLLNSRLHDFGCALLPLPLTTDALCQVYPLCASPLPIARRCATKELCVHQPKNERFRDNREAVRALLVVG